MKMIEFFKKELNDFNTFEKNFYTLIILLIILISIILKDSKIALISALCGISYTLLAGSGKIYCYYIGLIGTFCYCYICLKNGFLGNLLLYSCYFFPMQIIGLFNWKKHLKKNTNNIIKTYLNKKEKWFYFLITLLLALIFSKILILNNSKTPYIDSFTTIFSILGQFLTLKRCIEQWYVWFFVNILTLFMWINAYLNNSNCFATIIMWLIYTILAIYFYSKWKKELK